MVAAHRDWAKRTWDELVAYRAKTQASRDAAPGASSPGTPLGALPAGRQWYDNPYGGAPIRQSAAPPAVWIKRNGHQPPTPAPSFDPPPPTDPHPPPRTPTQP